MRMNPPRRERRLNDDERRQWVLNDEGLYLWWRQSPQRNNVREFCRVNRAELDACINRAMNRELA